MESLKKDYLIAFLGNSALNELYSWIAPDAPDFGELNKLIEK